MNLKVIHPMKKVRQRAIDYARRVCGLSKRDDFIYFDSCVNAFLAGYMSAIREQKRKEDEQ